MENTTESRETFAASNPTPQGQDGSSLNAAFDVDAFVHASGDGFGNTAPLRSDTGAIDMDAISQVAHVTQGAGKLTRKEKKRAKREMKRKKKEAKKAEKEAKKTYSSVKSQLKDRDKELSDKMADARKKRDSAKDVVNYIGYNKMYQDGICEVEEGMFSSSDRSRSARNAPCRIANHRPCIDVRASSLRKIPLPCRPRPDGTGLS